MVEGRLRAEWDQTAQLYALTANIYRSKGRPPIHPDDLNPFRKKRMMTREQTAKVLKEMFLRE